MAVRCALALLALAAPLATLACADTMPTRRLDRATLTPSFDESFDHPPTFWEGETGKQGRWKTNYFFGQQDADQPSGWESTRFHPIESSNIMAAHWIRRLLFSGRTACCQSWHNPDWTSAIRACTACPSCRG